MNEDIRLSCQCGQVDQIEEATGPRSSMRDPRRVEETSEECIKAYWREHYTETFTSILQDLSDRLDSPLIIFCGD